MNLRERTSPIPITYKIISVIVIGVFIFWLISIVPIWIRTARFGHEFTYEYRQTRMYLSGSPNRIRVMEYSNDRAVVYYSWGNGLNFWVIDGEGNLLTFVREDEQWALYRWDMDYNGDDFDAALHSKRAFCNRPVL